MKKIAVLISGGGTNLQSLIDAVNAGKVNGKIDIVISNRKNAYGLTRAQNEHIDTAYFSVKDFPNAEEYDRRIIAELQKRNIDVVVLAGYLKILTGDFISAFEKRIINIHPSLIPSFCGKDFHGMNVHNAVIKKGVKFTGATTHFVDENIDTGMIILQAVVPVTADDTAETVAEKVLVQEHDILVKTVAAFCDDKIRIQNNRAFIE